MNTNRYAMPTDLKSLLYAPIGLAWLLACVCPSALAGEKMSGRAVFLTTPPTTIPIGANEDGHAFLHTAERGTQMEFSGADWLKECSLLRTGTCDLVHGRGSCYGYQIWAAPNGDRLVAKYSGVILPDAKSDKKPPDTILRGTWVYMRGSGTYAGITGAGVYSGKHISATEYELEWSGEIERRVTAEQPKGE